MRLTTVKFAAALAATVIGGCYLYSPDVTLDNEVKNNPRSYICAPSAAHPLEALKRQSANFIDVDLCSYPPLDPISLVPVASAKAGESSELHSLRDDDQLRSAIAYAEYARDQYMAAKRQGGAITPFMASILAPVAGTAIAVGSLGISSTAVTALSAAGGALVGGASVVQNKDREKIYVTGSQGVQCLLTNMQPYTYINRDKLSDLQEWLNMLAFYRLQLASMTAAVQLEPQADPCNPKQKDPKSILKHRQLLLQSAGAADKAAATTDTIGVTFLRTAHDSPATIVYGVDKINNSVSQSIIATEPDVQDLAQKLQKTITTEDQTIASVPSAKSATTDASKTNPPLSKMTPAEMGAAGAGGTPAAAAPAEGAAPSATATPMGAGAAAEAAKPIITAPPPQQSSPIFTVPYGDFAMRVTLNVDDQLSETIVDLTYIAGKILDIVGDSGKPPNNDSCPSLAKTAGVAKVLTFVPDGDIIVPKDGKTDLTVAGAQYPYVRPLFSHDNITVTATLKENSVLEVAATKDALPGEYPFFVGDGPTGKPVNAVILYQAPPTCPQKKPTKTTTKKTHVAAARILCPVGNVCMPWATPVPNAAPTTGAPSRSKSQ